MSSPPVSICIFAYNEEHAIAACLDAIGACAGEAELTAHVLVNGCTDGTEAVVRAYDPRGRFRVMPVVVARGDKANAWNHYVHEVAPAGAAAHVFTDGDMQVQPGSIASFLEAFAAEPEAMGCAGLPVTGRSREAFRAKLACQRELAGNLYALRGAMVARFREASIRLPFGMFGEDGLVTMLIKHGLDPLSPQVDARVTHTPHGGFAFPSLSPWKLSDLRIYRNRRRRYAMRNQQGMMLYPLLKARGIGAMPAHVHDLYREHFSVLPPVSSNPVTAWFEREARARIERDLAKGEAARAEERAHLYS